MAKKRGRRIGEEILEGIREIKRGEVERERRGGLTATGLPAEKFSPASHLMKPSDRLSRALAVHRSASAAFATAAEAVEPDAWHHPGLKGNGLPLK